MAALTGIAGAASTAAGVAVGPPGAVGVAAPVLLQVGMEVGAVGAGVVVVGAGVVVTVGVRKKPVRFCFVGLWHGGKLSSSRGHDSLFSILEWKGRQKRAQSLPLQDKYQIR